MLTEPGNVWQRTIDQVGTIELTEMTGNLCVFGQGPACSCRAGNILEPKPANSTGIFVDPKTPGCRKAARQAGKLYEQGKEKAAELYDDASAQAEQIYGDVKDKVADATKGQSGTTSMSRARAMRATRLRRVSR